jgi:hypothetical protein
MENLTQLATTRLAPAQAYALDAQRVRRAAAIERQRLDYQADIARIQDLYANGSLRKATPAVAPAFTEATSYTVTRLAGGAALSGRKRSVASGDEATEAKRARRRARRAARKARQAAASVQSAN